MFPSVNQWSYGGGMLPSECLNAAIRQGFSGYEPAFSKTGTLSLEGFEQDAKDFRKIAADNNISMKTLASGLYWEFPFSSDDEAVRLKAQDVLKMQIDCAAALGASVILIVPGTVGTGFFGKGAAYADAYARALEGLNALEGYARASGIIIGVENVWNNFLLSPLEYARFIDECNSPYIQAYFDIGNALRYGDPADWIRTLGKRIAAIHVKDFRSSIGTLSGFVPLLEGDVPWAEAIQALRETGFDGGLTAEISPMKLDPMLAAQNARFAIERILAL